MRIRISSRWLLPLTIAYIYIPTLIFVLGWTRLLLALPATIVCLFFLYRFGKDCGKQNQAEADAVWVHAGILILVLAVISAVCVCAGLGGWFSQAEDWHKHNAVLHDLIDYRWPVIYTEREESMLTYYIGQYLVAAVAGKLTGSFRTAEIVLCIWSVAGVFLVFLNLLQIVKAKKAGKQIIILFLLLFFCGMLLPCQVLMKRIYGDVMYSMGEYHWMSVASIRLQYRSDFVMLRWVFSQCIVPWLAVLLFWKYRKKTEYYILIMMPVLLFASFSFIGLAALGIGLAVWHLICAKNKTGILQKCFSVSNLVPGILLGSIFFFYFWGYVKVEKPDYLAFGLQQYDRNTIWVYLSFSFFMFGLYAWIIWRENRREPCFYLVVLQLLVIPLFKMGLYNDFVMCTSIPALFLLEVFVIRFLTDGTVHEGISNSGIQKEREDIRNENIGIRKGILIVCLCIGAWYPILELSDNIMAKQSGNMSADGFGTMAYFADRENEDIQDDLKYNYYTYDLEHSVFYQYLAKK